MQTLQLVFVFYLYLIFHACVKDSICIFWKKNWELNQALTLKILKAVELGEAWAKGTWLQHYIYF